MCEDGPLSHAPTLQPLKPSTASFDLLAHAAVSLSPEAIQAMRRAPLRGFGDTFSVSSLKHFDDQTMAVLSALIVALGDGERDPVTNPFREWGVLAAPRNLGRALMGPSVFRFHEEGAWGVSPHLIPHHSLHSISGTVSQFLKAKGPNFGLGGALGSEVELLLTAPGLLEDLRVPGLWLVFSRVEPDSSPFADGRPHPDSRVEAVTLAVGTGVARARIDITSGGGEPGARPIDFAALAQLVVTLSNHGAVTYSLGTVGRLTARRNHESLTGSTFSYFPSRPLAG